MNESKSQCSQTCSCLRLHNFINNFNNYSGSSMVIFKWESNRTGVHEKFKLFITKQRQGTDAKFSLINVQAQTEKTKHGNMFIYRNSAHCFSLNCWDANRG